MTVDALKIPVVDIFAGPGGLGEGFSAFKDGDSGHPFRVCVSIEKDETAHKTLELRSFYRQFAASDVPGEYYRHLRGEMSRASLFQAWPDAAAEATRHAKLATLGVEPAGQVDAWISEALGGARSWILVGGPPCQAYSVAGRSRNRGVKTYSAEKDERHYLYKEYLRIISRHWPTAFVFENVKGLLTATVNEGRILDRILGDLRHPAVAMGSRASRERHSYRLYNISGDSPSLFLGETAADYIVKAENYGIPQSRHRLIILGVRGDVDAIPTFLNAQSPVNSSRVLHGVPPVRSMVSLGGHDGNTWLEAVRGASSVLDEVSRKAGVAVAELMVKTLNGLQVPDADEGGEFVPVEG